MSKTRMPAVAGMFTMDFDDPHLLGGKVPGRESYFFPRHLAGGDPAVELERERMVVLGQCVDGVDPGDLHIGQEMRLALATLHEDDDHEYVVWEWRPVAESGSDPS